MIFQDLTLNVCDLKCVYEMSHAKCASLLFGLEQEISVMYRFIDDFLAPLLFLNL
jgi:hypothetical protein